MNQKIIYVIVGLGLVGFVAMATLSYPSNPPISDSQINSSQSSAIQSNENTIPMVMETNGQKHLIPLEKIRSGGPPKDGIPSIDNPKFTTMENADFVSDSDVVIGLQINDTSRAYPLSILVWHEIVNDEIEETPIAVTYCPLCYTSQVFERKIDGREVEFGTSGKLYNSNLLMYDRLTNSYWSQSLGTAVTGPLTGTTLNTIPFDLILWGDWKKLHPETQVLTTDTGHIRSYGTDPYGNYYTDTRILFPVENMDTRISPKEIIIGFHDNNNFKAFKQKDVESKGAINDFVGKTPILLISQFDQNTRAFDRKVDGEILEFAYNDGKLLDLQTNSIWSYDGKAISGPMAYNNLQRLSIHPGFWFEWFAFHPKTIVYGAP